ncbi:MAG: membrane integrity-associated transporter subunit PqiC [Nitrospirota bacterium]
MNRIIKGFRISVACVFVLNFLGCGTSQPSHFYLLRALAPASDSGLSQARPSSLSLGLGPITFPQYLDRPQIVTKASAHEVELAEFHKWAEPLSENTSNVLAENLSALLSTDRIVQYPWKRSEPLDYQLSLEVIQFDGTKSQEAVLKVRWTLVGEDGETLLVQKTSHFTEPVGGLDYEDFVQAMSHTLDSLSKEIADAIKGLPSVSS